MMSKEWKCPKKGCEVGLDGHDFATAIHHIWGGDLSQEEARDISTRVLNKFEATLDDIAKTAEGLTEAFRKLGEAAKRDE